MLKTFPTPLSPPPAEAEGWLSKKLAGAWLTIQAVALILFLAGCAAVVCGAMLLAFIVAALVDLKERLFGECAHHSA